MFGPNTKQLKKAMPLLARHEGAWTGTHVHMDPHGKLLDEHTSELTCEFPKRGKFPYIQSVKYTWADGKFQDLHLPAQFKRGQLIWRESFVEGQAWQVDEKTLMMKWQHKGDLTNQLYEVIHLHNDDKERTRTLTWFQGEQLVRRTLVSERRKG